jgi:hypothetical protein
MFNFYCESVAYHKWLFVPACKNVREKYYLLHQIKITLIDSLIQEFTVT